MQKNPSLLVLLSLALLTISLTGCPTTHECSQEPHSRVHPYVFWDQDDMDGVAGKVAPGSPDRAWALPILTGILNSAASWLSADITVPDEGGGWTHEYVCPNHGATLIYDPDEPLQHLCPVGGEIWTGDPYDAAWRSYRHNSLGSALERLGLAFLLEEDPGLQEAYALRARAILLDYAGKYPDYPIHDRFGGTLPTGARTFAQTLDESVWLLNIVAGYDSIYDSGVLTQEDKMLIEADLLCASVNTILRYDAGKSNWQAWHNAAVGSVGFLLEDAWLIQHAVEGLHGFQFHMDESVQEDGIWYEGALSYHYYTLSAYLQLSEAAERSGIRLYDDPSYRIMFDGPVDTLMPNLEFPRINDVSSTKDTIRSRANAYEVANTRWNQDRENWLLNRIYTTGTNRSSQEALLYGSDVDETVSYNLSSVNLTASGLGILRAGSEPDTLYTLMDYGPHGGGHGHYDKLGIILFKGRELLPDMGTVKYALPEHEGWFTKTLSHNTLMMGEKSQGTGGESTRLIDFFGAPQADLQVMQATVNEWVFSLDGSATRTLLLVRDDYLLDVVTVTGGEGPYDLVYHVNADAIQTSGGHVFSDIPQAMADRWSASLQGHSYLRPPSDLDGAPCSQIQQTVTLDGWAAVFPMDGSETKLQLLAAGNEETTVILTDAPGNPFTEYPPGVILRRDGVSTSRYVTVLEPFEGTAGVSSVFVEGDQVEVLFEGETHRLTVDQAGHVYSLEIQTKSTRGGT